MPIILEATLLNIKTPLYAKSKCLYKHLICVSFCANLCKKVGKTRGILQKKKKNEKITTRFYFHIFIARFFRFYLVEFGGDFSNGVVCVWVGNELVAMN
ncbi:hypothetical protein CQA40_02130 [Helicobacter sp. MIT 01-3238]|nr:hypothetical protein CQA40_02130 [Helicobacter sp. MIT 01-3238]